VARHAYHGALATWKHQYDALEKPNEANLRKIYNAIKPVEFPWALEITRCAPQQAIKNAGKAYKNFFDRLKIRQERRKRCAYRWQENQTAYRWWVSLRLDRDSARS